MERHFELELEKLKKRILKMGNLVASQVHQTMVALVNCDVEAAEEIIEADNAVDELDVKIDKLCQRIFALTQPVATDLRLIMASLRMNNDLERMGDHAVNIAKRVEGLSDYKDIVQELKIDELAEVTDAIVRDVITNRLLVNAIDEARHCIQEGEDLAVPLKRAKVFPPIVTHMIAIGEKSGQLEEMLANIAEGYESEVDMAINSLTSILEPAIILLMGIIVAFIVLSILLPIFEMNQIV